MSDNISNRMAELFEPIEIQQMLCQTREDRLMLACVMLTRAKDMLLADLGPAGTAEIISGLELY